MLKNVLLIGAGGSLGVPVFREILEAGSYNVSVLARKESTSVFPEGVTVFKADYCEPSEVQVAMNGQDVVISIVGGQAAGDQRLFIDTAVAASVKRLFPSEFGPPSRDPVFATLNSHILPAKAATVDYLRTKESQMSWTSLITGAFFDWALKGGFFGLDLATKTVGLIDEGTTVFTASTLAHVAKAVIASLEHADEAQNQYVFISSFNVSQHDLDVCN